MNTAVIFAGGTGKRMHSGNVPKQFLELNGKPIIIHTIEHFDKHPMIDAIVVVCIADWIDFLKGKLEEFGITKVVSVIPGGKTGQESIRNGLYEIRDKVDCDPKDTVVLIHDGVRPLINEKLITDNIETVHKFGNAITVVPAIETIIEIDDDEHITKVADRSHCKLARAPQSFYLADILEAHRKSIEEGSCVITARSFIRSRALWRISRSQLPWITTSSRPWSNLSRTDRRISDKCRVFLKRIILI